MSFNGNFKDMIEENLNGLLSAHRSWERINLNDIALIQSGFAFKSKYFNTKQGMPIARIRDVKRGHSETLFESEYFDEYLIDNGDYLVGMDGDFNAALWHGGKALLNQRVSKISVFSKNYDERFLQHVIQGYLDAINNYTSSVTVKHLAAKTMREIPLPLPPIDEQKRIADKLDQILEEVNSAKARLEQIPTILKNFRQSVLKVYLSPKSTWKSEKLGDLLEDLRYGTSKKCSYDNDGTPILRIPNVSGGQIDPEDMKYTKLDEKEYSKLSLRKGDILIIRSNGSINLVGRTALIDKEKSGWGFAGYLIRLRFDPNKIDPEFLNYYLASPKIRDYIELTGRSTSGVNNINSKDVSDIDVAYPNIAEQKNIAAKIVKLMAFSNQIEERYNLAMENVDKIIQSLLAKAFRGELVPQDPNDELASTLLERIKAERELKESVPKQRKREITKKSQEIKKMILSVLDTLKKEKKPLTAQNLLQKSGYPIDSNPEKIEEFFLDITKSLHEGTIIRERIKNEDIFKLAA